MATATSRSLKDRFIQDKAGNVVLNQRPNLPQIVGWLALLASWPLGGRLGHLAAMIAYGAFFTWAWLEIFDGDSYARRTLGVIVLLGLLYIIW